MNRNQLAALFAVLLAITSKTPGLGDLPAHPEFVISGNFVSSWKSAIGLNVFATEMRNVSR